MYPRAFRRRLVQVVPVVLLATFLVFGLLQLVPGDPAVTLAGESASVERIAEIRRVMGFDQPLLLQYWRWLTNAMHGDLAHSLFGGAPVATLIAQKLPNTLLVVVLALGLAMFVGIPLGVAAAVRTGSAADAFVSLLAALGVAVPSFWLAMILLSIFALGLRWLPATGAVPLSVDAWQSLRHAILPAIALGASGIAEVARQLRGALTEVLQSQYVRTLRAKGLGGASIFWKHGLRNAGVTLLTVIGLLFNRMLGATVVIEAVFAVPGIGSAVVQATINKDFPVVQGVVLVMLLLVIATNLAIDALYALLDPRVRVQ
jgi:peptide/nickel transport system permease protein